MRPLTLTVRLAMAAAGFLMPWLLLASAVVDASPPHRTPTRWGRVLCDPRVPSGSDTSECFIAARTSGGRSVEVLTMS